MDGGLIGGVDEVDGCNVAAIGLLCSYALAPMHD